MPTTHSVRLLGLPTDQASSYAHGAAAGPAAIRAALYSEASSQNTESGYDLATEERFEDLGDITLTGGEKTRSEIEQAVANQIRDNDKTICLGGDHSVAFPILSAHSQKHEHLTVVQIDAHPDLYDSFEGDRYSHACPFARVMETGRVKRLVQIGIRTANQHQRQQAQRFGVEIVPRASWIDLESLNLETPVYLSIDLDGLDPAYAPGVSHPEAGGLTTREVLNIIWQIPELVGADVVELNPRLDIGGITAVLAAKLVKELAGRLMDN